ncbi:MAG: ABC transporter substrate-binding protein [Alphaproteobacteria bacterium]|nr:ABC transporter substrate-binding protein [Alphaproteobacteria bacterium]
MPTPSSLLALIGVACGAFALTNAASAQSKPVTIPVLVPLTGFLSLEGTSQRNGADLALREVADDSVRYDVSDTATSPEVAVNALERAMTGDNVVAVVAPMLGTQMLALVPLADEFKVPLVTVSGTAKITELGSPNVYRFFPGDVVVKQAHARYAVEELGIKKPAVVFQTTAYGQSGRVELTRNLQALGSPPVIEEAIDVSVKDMLPVLSKVRAAGADALLLHLHAGSTALVIKQARAAGINLPIIAGSAMHQPQTAALLEPSELAGVCAESGSSPISGGNPKIDDFAKRYRAAFDSEPDAFALGQYDAVRMILAAVNAGARTPDAIRQALANNSHDGLAMRYRSDGKGNMAHDAVIICYDGAGRTPNIVKRYENVTGAR